MSSKHYIYIYIYKRTSENFYNLEYFMNFLNLKARLIKKL